MDKNAKTLEDIFILNDKDLLLADFLPLPEGKDVELDLGCGKGGFAAALAQSHPERIILAADVMLGRLRKVRKKLNRAPFTSII